MGQVLLVFFMLLQSMSQPLSSVGVMEEGSPASGAGHGDTLADVEAALDKWLAGAQPDLWADDDSVDAVAAIHRIMNKVAAIDTRVVRQADQRQLCQRFGLGSTTNWLAWRHKTSRTTARRRVSAAAVVPLLPGLGEAMVAGRVGVDHAATLAALDTPETRDDLVRTHELLVDDAQQLGFLGFRKVCAWWLRLADPDRADRTDRHNHDKRGVTLAETTGGWHLAGWLSPIDGQTVADTLSTFEDRELKADRATARAEHGDHATYDQLPRTRQQRRADALVAAMKAAGTAPADARAPRPVANIVIDHLTFTDALRRRAGLPVDPTDPAQYRTRTCRLTTGTPINAADALDHLLSGWVRRVVIDPHNIITDASARQRLFTGPLADMLRHLLGECRVPGCHVPAEHCDIDHVTPHADGGLTITGNGDPACRRHNLRTSATR